MVEVMTRVDPQIVASWRDCIFWALGLVLTTTLVEHPTSSAVIGTVRQSPEKRFKSIIYLEMIKHSICQNYIGILSTKVIALFPVSLPFINPQTVYKGKKERLVLILKLLKYPSTVCQLSILIEKVQILTSLTLKILLLGMRGYFASCFRDIRASVSKLMQCTSVFFTIILKR